MIKRVRKLRKKLFLWFICFVCIVIFCVIFILDIIFKLDLEVKGYKIKDKVDVFVKENWLVL